MKERREGPGDNISFGSYVFDSKARMLTSRDGARIFMEHRLRDIFSILLKNEGEFVNKDELMELAWKDTVVSEQSVPKAISDLRKFFVDNCLEDLFRTKCRTKILKAGSGRECMRNVRRAMLGVIGIAACGGMTACIGNVERASGDNAASVRGAELLQPFKKNLQQALLKGMKGGPEQAIDVCKNKAPAIANEISVDGVQVGRSSHRLRNPSNHGPDWVTPVLQAYVDGESDLVPVTVSLPGERVGYVEPIKLQPVCLVCHGTALAPNVQARIKQQYPSDQATGFKVDDLRGVFWAAFPASETESAE